MNIAVLGYLERLRIFPFVSTDISYSVVEQEMCMEISGLCIPWLADKNLPSNVCDLISCPLDAGKHYQITEKIAIPESFPDVSVNFFIDF